MAKRSGSKKVSGTRKMPAHKTLHAGNHNSSGMMQKHSPKAMRGQGKC